MARVRVNNASEPQPSLRPGATPDSREQQMINLAVNLAEKQLRDGTASSQVITHYLKLGTEKARLEQVKLANETALLEAKTEAIKSGKRMEELYEQAIKAMQRYAGHDDQDDY